MITSGKGRCKVFLKKEQLGDDVIYLLGGGDKPHIGGIVICQPGKKTNVISFKDHKDYIVLKIIAKAFFKKYKKKITVLGGIHINNASKEEIDAVIKNCKQIAKKL